MSDYMIISYKIESKILSNIIPFTLLVDFSLSHQQMIALAKEHSMTWHSFVLAEVTADAPVRDISHLVVQSQLKTKDCRKISENSKKSTGIQWLSRQLITSQALSTFYFSTIYFQLYSAFGLLLDCLTY